MMPTVAVVIPAYNAAATLPRALDSVLAQDQAAHEVIVVDDGSTDTTAEVVQTYARRSVSPPVRLVRQVNLGPSSARNRGVQEATAQWVAFLDGDDWYYPDRLALHMQMIEADPALDFVVGAFDYRSPDGTLLRGSMPGTVLGRELLARHGPEGVGVIDGADLGRFIEDQFSDTRLLTLPRATFERLGGFPEELRICEDVVFLLRLCATSRRAGVTCRPAAAYCVHDAGLIRSDRGRAQTESIRALRLQKDEMAHVPPAIRAAWKRMVKRAFLDHAYHLTKHGARVSALVALAQSFAFQPAVADIRDLLSVVRG